ncbi:TadE/TadG family type IV pilus assembly protein [Acidocella sp.]|uniref:TadE/TadG family type IV pilus assembly protein n=1 Tax=Acidocella sp. TaxID=50710 RepID=UPI00261536A4|nr:TadE/TadG family type IV pilus assembly protein [Acidocella sp.]
MQIASLFHRDRHASISVEFALISTLIFLPLLAGGVDFTSILSAKSQMNTAMQSMLYYAWANDSHLTSNNVVAQNTANASAQSAVLASSGSGSVFNITLASGTVSGSNSNVEYACVSGGNGAYTVSSLQPFTTGTSCSSGQTLQLYIQYQLNVSFGLAFPLPGFSNPYSLSITGTAQI